MAKRITDFFGVSSKKQKPSNSESYILPQNVTTEASNSNTTFTINQVEDITDYPSSSSEWYKGFKLDANWLIQTFEFLKKVKLGKRSGIQCISCINQISQAKKLSRNGQVPIADGVRCDGKRNS